MGFENTSDTNAQCSAPASFSWGGSSGDDSSCAEKSRQSRAMNNDLSARANRNHGKKSRKRLRDGAEYKLWVSSNESGCGNNNEGRPASGFADTPASGLNLPNNPRRSVRMPKRRAVGKRRLRAKACTHGERGVSCDASTFVRGPRLALSLRFPIAKVAMKQNGRLTAEIEQVLKFGAVSLNAFQAVLTQLRRAPSIQSQPGLILHDVPSGGVRRPQLRQADWRAMGERRRFLSPALLLLQEFSFSSRTFGLRRSRAHDLRFGRPCAASSTAVQDARLSRAHCLRPHRRVRPEKANAALKSLATSTSSNAAVAHPWNRYQRDVARRSNAQGGTKLQPPPIPQPLAKALCASSMRDSSAKVQTIQAMPPNTPGDIEVMTRCRSWNASNASDLQKQEGI